MAIRLSSPHQIPERPVQEQPRLRSVMIRRSWAQATAASNRRSTSVERSGVTEPMTDVPQRRAA